jgi:hypothetical protein
MVTPSMVTWDCGLELYLDCRDPSSLSLRATRTLEGSGSFHYPGHATSSSMGQWSPSLLIAAMFASLFVVSYTWTVERMRVLWNQ